MAAAAPAPRGQDETTPPWRWPGVGLGLAAVALFGGLALRVVAPSPLWLDEALSINIASLDFGDMVDALRHDGHPGLYYLLLGWWMDLFGDSNGAVRALSGVFSLATVPVLWAIGHRRSPELGFAAALVALTSPFLLRYGTEARMYALVTFLVACGWLAVERAVDDPGPRRLGAVALVTAALIHTHYWAFWLIGATFVILAVVFVREPERRPLVVRVGAAVAAGSATFVVWIGVFFDQLGSTGTPWAERARPAELLIESLQAVGGNNRFEGEILGIILLISALLGLWGVAGGDGTIELRFRRGPLTVAAAAAVLTLGIGGVVALATDSAFESRYAAAVVPFVLVLAARGITLIPGRIGMVALDMMALGVVVLFGLAVGADEARRDRSQAGEVAAIIDRDHQPGDIVAFCPDQLGPATKRALSVELETLAFPRGDGTLIDWQDYAEVIAATPAEEYLARVEEAAAGNDIWLVAAAGYRSLDNRCEEIIDTLNRTRQADHRLSPASVFEPMLLTRYEPRP